MRIILTLIFVAGLAHGQNCSPEAIQNEKELLAAGEFRGPALLSKLEGLIKELKILANSKYSGAQKNAMKYCLKIKDQLFQKLMLRPEPSIQENASFQETVAEFYKLHGDLASSMIYMDRAVQIEPKNLSILIKNLQLFAEAQNIQLKEIADKPIAIAETKRVFEEFARRAARVSDHPEASKELALETLTYQANVARALKNFPQEMQIWEKVIVMDPLNKAAHQKRFSYFVSKSQSIDAIESMKRMTRDKLESTQNWTDFLHLLANSEKWNDYISWTNKAPAALITSKPEFRIRLARAYLELNRKEEAEKIMKDTPKNLKGDAGKLAQQNIARLREFEADELKAQGRLSEALDEYKKALPHSPRPLTLKEKISLLIYEYRKGLNFKPLEATRADLEEVVSLLSHSVYKTELKSTLFGIYLHSLKLIERGTELNKACARFKEIYPELLRSKDYISYCQQAKSEPIQESNGSAPALDNNRKF